MKALLLLITALLAYTTNAQTFKQKEVKRDVAGGTLYGTMLTPKNSNGTAIVFISGSGPTDRDGNSMLEGKNNSLKLLAEALGTQGYPSLRFDKRAIGKSMPGFPEKDLRFETYVDDVAEWVNWLKANNKDIKKVVIAGHSEGSLIGMLAAKKVSADGFISIAGAGAPGDTILKVQLESKLPPKLYDESAAALDSLAAGYEVKNPPLLLAALFRADVQPYLVSWFKYNPAAEIAKLSCPILIVQGLNDLQLFKHDAEALAKAAPKAQLLLLERVTHVLKEAGPSQAENIDTYRNENLPIAPELVKGCLEFLDTIK